MFLFKEWFFFFPFFFLSFFLFLKRKSPSWANGSCKTGSPLSAIFIASSEIELTVQARRHAAVVQWTDQTSLPKISHCPQIWNFPGNLSLCIPTAVPRRRIEKVGWDPQSWCGPQMCIFQKQKQKTWPVLVSRATLKAGRWPWTNETSQKQPVAFGPTRWITTTRTAHLPQSFCFTGNFEMYASVQKEKQNT